MSLDLQGRVAVVTGSGRGIGREIALGLAREGVHVALLARTHKEVDDAATEITALGVRALALTVDVSETSAAGRALTQVSRELGPVDILINNAAVVWPLGATASIDFAQWQLAAQINLIAPVHFTTVVLPGMIERGWGRIVNVSSGVVAAPGAMIGGNAYATTKAALESHTLNLAAELRGTGVTANVFRPGAVDTAMQSWIREQEPDEIGQDLHQRFTAMHESGTLLTPEQSASAMLVHLRNGGSGEIWNVSG